MRKIGYLLQHEIRKKIEQNRGRILDTARRYGVTKIRVFGSTARGEATKNSDLDLLVAFESGRSLLDLIGFRQDLEELLGIHVDVVSERGLSPYLRDHIFKEAMPF